MKCPSHTLSLKKARMLLALTPTLFILAALALPAILSCCGEVNNPHPNVNLPVAVGTGYKPDWPPDR